MSPVQLAPSCERASSCCAWSSSRRLSVGPFAVRVIGTRFDVSWELRAPPPELPPIMVQ